MRGERSAVRTDTLRDGVQLHVLVLLPVEDAGAVPAGGEPLCRLRRPLLLRVLRPLPGVQGAQDPRLRPTLRYVCARARIYTRVYIT